MSPVAAAKASSGTDEEKEEDRSSVKVWFTGESKKEDQAARLYCEMHAPQSISGGNAPSSKIFLVTPHGVKKLWTPRLRVYVAIGEFQFFAQLNPGLQ